MGSNHDVMDRHNKQYAKQTRRQARPVDDIDVGRLYGCLFAVALTIGLWLFGQYFPRSYERPVNAVVGLALGLFTCGFFVLASEYLRRADPVVKAEARIVGFEQALGFFAVWVAAALVFVVIYQSRSDWQIDTTEVAIPLFMLSVLFTLSQGLRNRL